MDIALLVITVLSMATAAVAFTSARRVQRAEQQRSDARVAALAAASADAQPVHENGRWKQAAGEWQWNPQPDGIRDLDMGIRSARVADRLPTPDSPIPVANLFGTVQREQPPSGWLAFVAAAAFLIALGGALVVYTTSGHGKASAPVAQAPRLEPLELVSLGHSREASLLTIAGSVRNPATGQKIEGLTAVVSLIDGHGGLISTKDVPLDYRALGPGEEAPFKLTVPDPGSVARYRVSFRAGTDVVPHVDRRSDSKIASAL